MDKNEVSHLLSAAAHQLEAAAHLIVVGKIDEATKAAHSGAALTTFALEMGKDL